METTCAVNTFHSAFESTFDHIQSPQYMDFVSEIPEARDSFFDKKKEDDPMNQQFTKNLQKLPNDFSDNFIKPLELLGISNTSIIEGNMKTSTPFRIEGVEPIPWPSKSPSVQATPTNHDHNKNKLKPRPFSFDERNKQLVQRKVQRMKTILDAEKEARKFRANPVPSFLKKNTANSARGTSATEQRNKATYDTLATTAPPKFRARSPKVLRRPPFQPILPRQPLAPPPPFVLNSEVRAKEREQFDNFIKEKERLDNKLRQMREAARKKREEEEILKMRRAMVHKAQPVKKFKCVTNPVTKRPLTEPMTPMVIKRQRR